MRVASSLEVASPQGFEDTTVKTALKSAETPDLPPAQTRELPSTSKPMTFLSRAGSAGLGALVSALRPVAVFGAMAGVALFAGPAMAQAQQRTAPTDSVPVAVVAEAPNTVSAEVRNVAARAEETACKLDREGRCEEARSLRMLMAEITADPIDGPLAQAIIARGAMGLSTTKVTSFDDGKPESWRLSTRAWMENDGPAGVIDGHKRSDDGHTGAAGFDFNLDRGPQHLKLALGYNLFTEAGGMRRTDFLEALATYAHDREQGNVVFDLVTPRLTVGLQATGDFGGEGLQDALHHKVGGRYAGQGLQNQYTGDQTYAAVVGGGITGTKKLGVLSLSADVSAQLPIGRTGIGFVGASTTARLGRPEGPYAEASMGARRQKTNGEEMNFPGAPVSGGVYQPRVTVGWQGAHWNVSLDWTRNAMGIEPGLGGRNSDALWLSVTLGPKHR